jgi:hypothetical protein
MTLATHTIIGLGLTSLVGQNPAAAFIVSLAGHYAADAIPHWDYTPAFLIKTEGDKMATRMAGGAKFLLGLAETLLEFGFGVAIAINLFDHPARLPELSVMASIIGSILPDLMQPLYYIFRREPFVSLQKFHNFWHGKKEIKDPFWGVLAQVGLIAVFTSFIYLAK